MALTYGFFDSKNHDRTYNAEQMGSLFAGIIKDGVFADFPNQYEHMLIEGSSDANEKGCVYVGPGRAWFNHIWVNNDGYLKVDLAAPTGSARKDMIVLEIRKNTTGTAARRARIIALTGTSSTPTAAPADSDPNVYRYMLAWVNVPALGGSVTSDGIHYTRYSTIVDGARRVDTNIHNVVGVNEDVPYIVAPLVTVTAANVLNEWKDEVDDRISSDLATYLNDDGSALYNKLADIRDKLAHLSAHIQKVFYYVERPRDNQSNYYGEFSQITGVHATIQHDSSTMTGGIAGLYPRNATVLEGDILIGSTGAVAKIVAGGITRHETTGYILSIEVETVGVIDRHTREELASFRVNTNLALGMAQQQASNAVQEVNALRTEVTAALNDMPDRIRKVFYYAEKAQSDGAHYHGYISDTAGNTSTIVSDDAQYGVDGFYPKNVNIAVGDVLIGSRGTAATVVQITRASNTNKILSVVVQSLGGVSNQIASIESQLSLRAIPYIVNISYRAASSSWVSDKTFAQIWAAWDLGRPIEAYILEEVPSGNRMLRTHTKLSNQEFVDIVTYESGPAINPGHITFFSSKLSLGNDPDNTSAWSYKNVIVTISDDDSVNVVIEDV